MTAEPSAHAIPKSLAEALGRLQADMPAIVKDQRANTGQYAYAYADLAQISREVLPLLQPLGLAWITKPTTDAQGRFCLEYSLLHVSGEREDGCYPLNGGGNPQQRGSEISYARRYVLCSVLGVAPEADDDGAAATAHYVEQPERASRARKITKGQITAVQTGFSVLGFGGDENREQRLQITARLAGLESLASTSDLTSDQAKRVLDGLAERKRRQAEEPSSGGEGGTSGA